MIVGRVICCSAYKRIARRGNLSDGLCNFRVQARPEKADWWVETRSSRSKVYRVERFERTEDKQVSGLGAASCRISEQVFLSEFLRDEVREPVRRECQAVDL